jgi:hypothetical protein
MQTASFDGRSASFTAAQGPPAQMMYAPPGQQTPFSSYRSYSDLGVNGHIQNGMNGTPQIYTVSDDAAPTSPGLFGPTVSPRRSTNMSTIFQAVYSGVSVYEMEINGVAVMRRRSDSWLNATQILKVAGVDKGKRTKVLEKEVLTGEHEKVQGGYGKYGTPNFDPL